MATELKPCERCGCDQLSLDHDTVKCCKCGHSEWESNWNTRAMPECVREYLNIASQWIGYQGKIETRAALKSVLKYYGEGGE